MDPSKPVELPTAIAVSRMRAWRTALLDLHKVLVDAELARYAAAHGAVSGPHHAMKLLSEDPWFTWLRPFVVMVVQIDERLADRTPVSPADAEVFRTEVRQLVQLPEDTAPGAEYRRSLQELPAAVVIHGRLLELTAERGN